MFRGNRTLLSAIKSQAQQRNSSYVAPFKRPTMSDLPTPQGSWEHVNAATQRRNNMVLLTGIAFFGGSLTFFLKSGFVQFGEGPKIGN